MTVEQHELSAQECYGGIASLSQECGSFSLSAVCPQLKGQTLQIQEGSGHFEQVRGTSELFCHLC